MTLSILSTTCSKDAQNSNLADDLSIQDSLQKKIGQMIMVGYSGSTIQSDNLIVRDIKKFNLGGIILFKWADNITNPQQLKELVKNILMYDSIPLLIGIDQEGGKVSRLNPEDGFPSSVSAQYLGDLNNEDSTHFWYAKAAKTLGDMGINLDFAPVVDLNVNKQSPAIGKLQRSYSAAPTTVNKHAEIFIDELHKMNVFATLKHFPGHGSAVSDSHLGFVDVSKSWTLQELEPYKYFIANQKTDLIMIAHIFNSNIDPIYPASLSYSTVTGILRTELKYNGVVITDELSMGAIAQNYTDEEAIEKAINAGNDMLLYRNQMYSNGVTTTEYVSGIIKKLLESKKISVQRIEESYARIMKLKSLKKK